FCMEHFFEINQNPYLFKVLIKHVKIHDFNDVESRKMLLDLSYHAIDKIKVLSCSDALIYADLLETCISLMTEKELKDSILPKIEFNKLGDHGYALSMHGALCCIFNKINDQELLVKYFLELLT